MRDSDDRCLAHVPALRTILHTIDTPGSGGAETVCADLASGLDPSRFRSSAAVVDGGWLFDTLVARGVDTSITRMGRGGFDVGYMRRLATIARQQRASLIQSHLLTTNLYGGMVARLLGIPAIAAFHGMVDIAPDDRLARVKLRLITSCVSRLVFVSRAL